MTRTAGPGRLRRWLEPALLIVTVGTLVAGVVAWLAGRGSAADVCWAVGTLVAVPPALGWVIAPRR